MRGGTHLSAGVVFLQSEVLHEPHRVFAGNGSALEPEALHLLQESTAETEGERETEVREKKKKKTRMYMRVVTALSNAKRDPFRT